jgi:hypothetical protein
MLQFIATASYNSDSDWLTPWDSHSWQAASFSASQGIPLILSKPEFIRHFLSTAHHISLPLAISVQSISSHTIPLRSILILSPILRLGPPTVVFPSDLRYQNPISTSPLFSSHLFFLYVITPILLDGNTNHEASQCVIFYSPHIPTNNIPNGFCDVTSPWPLHAMHSRWPKKNHPTI